MKNLMKTMGVAVIILVSLMQGFSQKTWKHPYLDHPDSIDVTFYKPNPDTTVYHAIHTVFGAMEPFSYFNFFASYRKKFKHPQVDSLFLTGTGRDREKMRLEINFYIPLTLFRGRGQSKNWLQASRLTFDYWGQIRVAKLESSPILPPTNAFGFTWDLAPKDNFRREVRDEIRTDRLDLKKELDSWFLLFRGGFDDRHFWKSMPEGRTFKLWTLQFKFMHYSNGQGDGFFFGNDVVHHDYANGDFSTNYLQGLLGHHWIKPSGNIWSMWGGYRVDFQFIPGLFKFADEQYDRYGQQRLLLNLQWVSKPRRLWRLNKDSKDFSKKPPRRYFLKEFVNVQFRTEMMWILGTRGDLDQWRGYTKGDSKNRYPFGIKTFFKLNFLRNRNFGLLLMHYYGRDYHNIRFDNVVNVVHFGFNFKFNKNPLLSFPQKKWVPFKSSPGS